MRAVLGSVVIPAFDEGSRLPPFLADLVSMALEHEATPVELLVVDDGSAPEHLARHQACVAAAAEVLGRAGSRHAVRLIENPSNQGKGGAIRLGWREADPSSTWLGFLDADGAVPAGELWRLVDLFGDGVDALAGSRILMAGRKIRRSAYRHLQGRVFATLAEWSFRLGFYDTQCGVKFFRSSLLRPYLPILREQGWLLDVEVLALVHRQQGRFREEPIDWIDPGGSKVRFGIDALRMLFGLRRIRRGLDARFTAREIPSPGDARRGPGEGPPGADPAASAGRR